MKLNETEFIKKIKADVNASKSADIEELPEINKKLKGLMPKFDKRGIDNKEYTVLSVDSVENFEGIIKVASVSMIPPGKKVLSRRRKHFVVGDALPRVVCPIVIKNGPSILLLLCAQDRMTLGGKVSIEVYRGAVSEGTPSNRLGISLVERKIPNLLFEADILEVRDLGYYWNNTGISGVLSPVQALFLLTKKNTSLEELKHNLKLDHSMDVDPKEGPALPATEPVLKTFEEAERRLDEILEIHLVENESMQAYLNDMFSMTALEALFRSIKKQGLPY